MGGKEGAAVGDSRSLVRQIRVASPCPADWARMAGDERVRFCSECRLHVYNLSVMTEGEIEDLVREKDGRLCVRFFRRADGTVLTGDCPVGRSAARRRLAWISAGVAAVLGAIGGLGFAQRDRIALGTRDSRLRRVEPFRSVLNWLFPVPFGGAEVGKLMMPRIAPPAGEPGGNSEK